MICCSIETEDFALGGCQPERLSGGERGAVGDRHSVSPSSFQSSCDGKKGRSTDLEGWKVFAYSGSIEVL